MLACGLCSLSRSRGSGGGGESGADKGSDGGLAGSQRQGAEEEEEVLSFALQAFETSLVPVFLVGVGDRGPRGFASRSAQSGVTLACLHTPLPATFHSLPLPPTQTPPPLPIHLACKAPVRPGCLATESTHCPPPPAGSGPPHHHGQHPSQTTGQEPW